MTIFKWDVAEDWQLGFQDSASPVMEEIINFHNYAMIYLTFILIATSWIMAETMRSYGKSTKVIAHKYLIHGTTIEIIWTITPAIVLILIALGILFGFKFLFKSDSLLSDCIINAYLLQTS